MRGDRGRGALAHQAGRMAEAQVARHYEARGLVVHARRWRGAGGEIDLVLRDGTGGGFVFVEVKRSRAHARAAEALGVRQLRRLQAAAAEFLGAEPGDLDTPARFDLALVDAAGRVEVIENVLAP
jgi:putative endonuclease